MARYIKDFQISVDPQTAHSAVDQYLQREGYEYINFDGENVFKKGNGIIANPTFFKLSYSGNMVRMETWMKYALLPGVYVGELDTTGFVGSAVKGPWKNRIKNIENTLTNFAMQTTYYSPASVQNTPNTFDDNETHLLNDNDAFEETCVLSDNKVESISTKVAFCTGCGAPLSDGTIFCSVCGQKRTEAVPQTINTTAQEQKSNQSVFPPSDAFNYGTETTLPPSGYPVSRKEFINKYAQPSLKKNITSIAILCYVCAGLTFIVSCLANPWGIIEALMLAGLALGMHLAKSKVCAILILILSIIEVLLSLVVGAFPFWWLIAGISAVVTFNKIEKQYKSFIANGNKY